MHIFFIQEGFSEESFRMRRKINDYNLSPYVKQFKLIAGQFIVPITLFQTVRTLIFPSPVDLVLLALLILLGVALYMEWI